MSSFDRTRSKRPEQAPGRGQRDGGDAVAMRGAGGGGAGRRDGGDRLRRGERSRPARVGSGASAAGVGWAAPARAGAAAAGPSARARGSAAPGRGSGRSRRSRRRPRAAAPAAASSSPSRPTSTFPPDSTTATRSPSRIGIRARQHGGQRRRPGRLERPASSAPARTAARPGSSRRRAGRCRRGGAGPWPASRTPANGAPRPSATLVGLDRAPPRRRPSASDSGIRPVRLHAVDAGLPAARLDRRGDARDQPAATDADDDDVDIGQVLDQSPARPCRCRR